MTSSWDAVGFGKEVARLRKGRGLSIRAVAECMGVKSVAVAWKLENGMRNSVPGPLVVQRLADELGVTVGYLLRHAGYRVSDQEGGG